MRYTVLFIWIAVFALRAAGSDYLSPSALAVTGDGKNIFVACGTADRILRFDVMQKKVTGSLSVPASPSGLALSADETRLYVTCASSESKVCIIDTAKNRI